MPDQIIRAAEARDALAGDALAGDARHPDAPPDALLWAETLGTRLCHDLAGLVGTLAGAVEMLTEASGPAGDALEEVDRTARELTARLRLLRAAWGGDCGDLDRDDIAALLPGITASGRVGVDLSGLARRYPGPLARVLLNLLLLAVEAVPRGGAVALADAPCGGVIAHIEGPRAGWPPVLAPLLAADDPACAAPEPRGLQAPLLAALARRAGLRLALGQVDAGADTPPPLSLHRGPDPAP